MLFPLKMFSEDSIVLFCQSFDVNVLFGAQNSYQLNGLIQYSPRYLLRVEDAAK